MKKRKKPLINSVRSCRLRKNLCDFLGGRSGTVGGRYAVGERGRRFSSSSSSFVPEDSFVLGALWFEDFLEILLLDVRSPLSSVLSGSLLLTPRYSSLKKERDDKKEVLDILKLRVAYVLQVH